MKFNKLAMILAIVNTFFSAITVAQMPSTTKWTVLPPAISYAYTGWIYNYSANSSRYFISDSTSLRIMDGPFSTTPSVTVVFDQAAKESYYFADIPDVTGDGVRDIDIPRGQTGFRIVDGATGNTVWIFDDPVNYSYRLEEVVDLDHDGKNELVVGKSNADQSNYQEIVYGTNGIALSVQAQPQVQPNTFRVNQNYPNPFNPSTNISFSIPQQSVVRLTVTDVLGREVATLINNEERNAGNYNVKWNASSFASGVYFYRLQAGNFVQTKKLVLLK